MHLSWNICLTRTRFLNCLKKIKSTWKKFLRWSWTYLPITGTSNNAECFSKKLFSSYLWTTLTLYVCLWKRSKRSSQRIRKAFRMSMRRFVNSWCCRTLLTRWKMNKKKLEFSNITKFCIWVSKSSISHGSSAFSCDHRLQQLGQTMLSSETGSSRPWPTF